MSLSSYAQLLAKNECKKNQPYTLITNVIYQPQSLKRLCEKLYKNAQTAELNDGLLTQLTRKPQLNHIPMIYQI